LPEPKAEFVTVTVRYVDEKKVARETFDETGWLVRREKDVVEVYTPHGRVETARPGEKKRVSHSEKAPDGNGWVHSEIDITVDVDVSPGKLDDVIKEVEASRKKDAAGQDFSRRGPLTAQFEGRGATLYESILGAWLYRAGRDADAARVLLPALDSQYADRHLPVIVRHRLGDLAGYRMLVAFAGDQDYAVALKEARLINRVYPDTRFHDYAKGLAQQLPRRMDDFTRFKLPTPGDWADLKKTLTREQQIEFLCSRLRLMNCFQLGQPGGYDSGATQYAEPSGMESDASWGLGRGKTMVINPLSELTGKLSMFRDDAKSKGLNLKLKDVPALSKHLRDDWYMLIVSFWRDFHPDRNLSRTRPRVANIINEIAGKDVCEIGGWDKLKAAEIDREIERINKWASDNAGKSRVELDWEALKEELEDGARWSDVADRVDRLLDAKQTAAYDVLKKYLEDTRTDEDDKSRILRTYLACDVVKAKDLAPKFLDAKYYSLRETAALIVLRTGGDRTRARQIIGDALEAEDLDRSIMPDAVEELLKDGSAESRRQVARVFGNGRLVSESDSRIARVRILKACAAAGMTGPYQFYLPLIDRKGELLTIWNKEKQDIGAAHYSPSISEAMAEEIVTQFAPDDPAVKEIAKKFPKPADRIGPLKEWLRSRLDKAKE
jgi:hypothetical protein